MQRRVAHNQQMVTLPSIIPIPREALSACSRDPFGVLATERASSLDPNGLAVVPKRPREHTEKASPRGWQVARAGETPDDEGPRHLLVSGPFRCSQVSASACLDQESETGAS